MKAELATEDAPLDISGNGIWQRLPNESPGSYAAFAAYLELGVESTLLDVADKTGRSLRSIGHLSWRHNWMDRAAAYRQHVSQTHLASVQRQRARQTELSQMRDEIFRQELWEQRQAIRSVIRKGLNALVEDPKPNIAAYELARLMDIDFKSGSRATAPTGFTFDGPAPASPQFEEALKKSYSEPLPLDELLELMLITHPQHHAMIKQKFAAAAGSPTPEASNSGSHRGRDAAPPGSAHSLSVPQGGRQVTQSSIHDQASRIEHPESSIQNPVTSIQHQLRSLPASATISNLSAVVRQARQ